MSKIDFVVIHFDVYDKKTKKIFDDNFKSNNKYKMPSYKFFYNKEGLCLVVKSIQKHAPWYRKIFVVSDSNIDYLLSDSIIQVKSEDIIDKEYLPNYNINNYELNIHRIELLSEQFVLFTPGNFLINNVDENFFFKKKLPCDFMVEEPFDIDNRYKRHILANDVLMLSKFYKRHVSYKKILFKNISLFNLKDTWTNMYNYVQRRNAFYGFREKNMPVSLLKSKVVEFHKIFENELLKSYSVFETDFNVDYCLIKYFFYVNGYYYPKNVLKYEKIIDDALQLSDLSFDTKIISINLNANKTELEDIRNNNLEVSI